MEIPPELAGDWKGQADFLESFNGVAPVDIDPEDRATLHTLPFRLVKGKVVVAVLSGGNVDPELFHRLVA